MRQFLLLHLVAFATFTYAADPTELKHVVQKAGWYSMTATFPKLDDSPLGRFTSKEIKRAAQDRFSSFLSDINKYEEKPERQVVIDWNTTISISNKEILSGTANCFMDFGGAHPNRDYTTFNYLMIDGKPQKVGLANLMKTRQSPEALAAKLLLPKLKAQGASFVTSGEVKSFDRQLTDNFVITKSGLSWIFGPYQVASYAEGDIMVKLTWKELRPHLSPIGPLKKLMGAK